MCNVVVYWQCDRMGYVNAGEVEVFTFVCGIEVRTVHDKSLCGGHNKILRVEESVRCLRTSRWLKCQLLII